MYDKDGYVYVSHVEWFNMGDMNKPYTSFSLDSDNLDQNISKDTMIGLTSKFVLGEKHYTDLITDLSRYWTYSIENNIQLPRISNKKENKPAEKEYEDEYNTNELPYTFSVPDDSTIIYDSPSYNGEQVQNLPLGTYTIVEEQYDDNGKLWGKLKSGIGWICLDEI